MTTTTAPSLADQIAAAQGWWRDAGVDCDFTDEPVQWLEAESAPTPQDKQFKPLVVAQPAKEAPPAISQVNRSGLPGSLDEFAHWWLNEPTLDEGGLFPRIPPRGKAGASLMVVVEQPEEADTQMLLSGRQGAFLNAILAAMGMRDEDLYLAAVLPRHVPMADWNTVGLNGTGDILQHHVKLAAPRRLLLLSPRIPPLLGHDPAQNPASFSRVELGDATAAALATRDLASMLNRPRWRADFWRRWLDWTEGAVT